MTPDEDQINRLSRRLLSSVRRADQSRPAGNEPTDHHVGNAFVNLAVGPSADYQWVILDRNDAIGPVSEGHVLGVDGLHNFVYVAVGNDRNRLEDPGERDVGSRRDAHSQAQLRTRWRPTPPSTACTSCDWRPRLRCSTRRPALIRRRSRSAMASSSTTSRSLLATTASTPSATRHSGFQRSVGPAGLRDQVTGV